MLKDKLLERLEADNYWENSNRGLYVVKYKGKLLCTDQQAYLTIAGAKKALYAYFRYTYSTDEQLDRKRRHEIIKEFVDSLILTGDITFSNLLIEDKGVC